MFYSKFLIAISAIMISTEIVKGNEIPFIEPLTDTIEVSVITVEKGITVSRCDTTDMNRCLRAEDALLKIPGLFINDNSGAAGLKTVSLRGLGSAQTSIFIDGIRVGNLMSGQTDLSMFSMNTYGNIVVDYAQNSINFITKEIPFTEDRRLSAKVSFTGGSFGTYLPSVSFGYKISDRMTAGINFSSAICKGHRDRNSLQQYSGGIDLGGSFIGGQWKAKGYINYSDRENPGAITSPYYSRQKDINGFLQGSFKKQISPLYSLFISSKAAHDNMRYSDDYSNNTYNQTEIQLNTSHFFRVAEWCKLSFSATVKWNGLSSDNYLMTADRSKALTISRISTTATGASTLSFERFKADISVEYAGAFDRGNGNKDRHCFSPAVNLRFNAFDGFDIVAFGRRGYHIPTFNDLYYAFSGNPDLKNEDAWLTDVGVEWFKNIGSRWSLSAKADGFFNWLTDKITWAPTPSDPNFWLPYNIGKVRSAGADINISSRYSSKDWQGGLSVRYSFQDARDRTPDSYTFDSPIAYISKHTFVLDANVAYKGWGLEAIWNLREGRKDSIGNMPGWNTLDITFDKTFNIKDFCNLTLRIAGRNVTNEKYEVSTGYPMPGWALYGGFVLSF